MRVVAIDGPVGSGKSTVAKAVADRLDLPYLESGAMYRVVALAALRRGIDPNAEGSADAVTALAAEVDMELGERVTVDGTDVTADLRSPEVGRVVSAVAAMPGVRTELVRRQREWVEEQGGAVVEGRDIGSVVFPDADLKVFLTASAEERARRRELDETADDLARRDLLDSTRAVSPLIVPQGAVVVDTTGRPAGEVVDEILSLLA
ncbi:MAG TPA: (d)CMP kinase [Acidimicrobiales bacterium]|nr:(d)CMP kinase [Acidimicrobiales bacterium]